MTFYWKEALIVTVKLFLPLSQKNVRTGPLEKVYMLSYSHTWLHILYSPGFIKARGGGGVISPKILRM